MEKATQSIETLFHALGADSVKDQEEFVHFFKDKEKYPQLTAIHERAISIIQELGLSSEKPLAFSICHAHVSTLKCLSDDRLFLDTPPGEYLKKEGFGK